MESSSSGQNQRPGTGAALEVVMSVELPDGCECNGELRPASDVRQSMTVNSDGDWTCHTIVGGEDGMEFQDNEVSGCCPCYQFASQECVAEVIDIQPPRVNYSVIVPDRSKIAPLIENLRDSGAGVTVHRIRVAGHRENDPATLTDKQRETIELAIKMGYFDRPRGANLQEIADELGVTPSAVSQRLNSVNRRLIHRYAEGNCLE